MQHYGDDLPWLKQAQDGVVAFVQRCISQLGGNPGPQANAQPISSGADYNAPARTAEQIKAEPAANEGSVSRAPRRFRADDNVETVAQRGELADPVGQSAPPAPKKIVIPKNGEWSL